MKRFLILIAALAVVLAGCTARRSAGSAVVIVNLEQSGQVAILVEVEDCYHKELNYKVGFAPPPDDSRFETVVRDVVTGSRKRIMTPTSWEKGHFLLQSEGQWQRLDRVFLEIRGPSNELLGRKAFKDLPEATTSMSIDTSGLSGTSGHP